MFPKETVLGEHHESSETSTDFRSPETHKTRNSDERERQLLAFFSANFSFQTYRFIVVYFNTTVYRMK